MQIRGGLIGIVTGAVFATSPVVALDAAGVLAGRGAQSVTRESHMNNASLAISIERLATKVERESANVWSFEYGSRNFYVMTDENHNRMRAMTPVAQADSLSPDDLRTLLEANFDRALDARYALYEGALWSVYIHPLRELGESQFEDALRQVSTLADHYGTSYSSSDMSFIGGR